MGLGLNPARAVAEMLNGIIWAESKGPKQVAQLYLPAVAEALFGIAADLTAIL